MPTQTITDQDLIDLYLGGNHSSLEKLIQRHKKRVYSYILMVVRDQHLAEDIFQDTFIKVINTLRSGNYKEEGKFIQWVMRIAHNLIIDHFRKNRRIPTVENDENFVVDQIHQDVRTLIEFLPPEQREVVMLRHYSDMSFKDIAEETNVSINTALGRMRYALINLRKLIEQKEIMLTIS
jgi:RNA polymerase sigma factor (sigma-70 family)